MDTNHGDGRSCLFFFYYLHAGDAGVHTRRCHSRGNDAVIAMDTERNMNSFGIVNDCHAYDGFVVFVEVCQHSQTEMKCFCSSEITAALS